MKRITIKSIALLNFKGVRRFEATFDGQSVAVKGSNATGKTTLFDAFTWALFGKDSQGRDKFSIKTLDANGNAIPRIPHEVVIKLDVNGEEITLIRRYNEIWKKRRGSAVETFDGHEEERLYNEVPCSVKEWKEKISAICSEDVFRLITNPLYFCSLRWEAQRAMLLNMAGCEEDSVIAAKTGREDFIKLLDAITGKTMEEYRREIGAKKARVKDELKMLPGRLDERRRDAEAFAGIDFGAARVEYDRKRAKLKGIEEQIADATARDTVADNAAAALRQALDAAWRRAADIEAKAIAKAMAEYHGAIADRRSREEEIKRIDAQIAATIRESEAHTDNAGKLSTRRKELIDEWRAIQAETLDINPAQLICPTCRRPFEGDDLREQTERLVANFNESKAARLAENARKGKECSRDIIAAEFNTAAALMDKAKEMGKQSDAIRKELDATDSPEQPTIDTIRALDPDVVAAYKECMKLDVELKAKTQAAATAPNEVVEDLQFAAEMLRDSISELSETLAKQDIAKDNAERIKTLELILHQQNEELARLEGIEFTMAEFAKAKIELVEQRINGLFRLVNFRMYTKQVNGGEVETCEATVDGVPFAALNSAMRINAGMDIINAVTRHEQISAPIFIDNAESINALLHTDAQTIQLIVTDDPKLQVSPIQ